MGKGKGKILQTSIFDDDEKETIFKLSHWMLFSFMFIFICVVVYVISPIFFHWKKLNLERWHKGSECAGIGFRPECLRRHYS